MEYVHTYDMEYRNVGHPLHLLTDGGSEVNPVGKATSKSISEYLMNQIMTEEFRRIRNAKAKIIENSGKDIPYIHRKFADNIRAHWDRPQIGHADFANWLFAQACENANAAI